MYLFLFGVMLAERFLVGLAITVDSNDVFEYFHPLVYFLSEDLSSSGASAAPKVMLLVYTAISALIAAIAWLLYRSFKVERAGDSITYRAVEYIFACVVAVAGLFIGGELLGNSGSYSFYGSSGHGGMDYVDKSYIVGAFIGAAVAFVIATMILRKSARVFDLRLLRRFAAFAVAVAVFFVCIMTNITGFETRVPAASDVSVGAFSTFYGSYVMPPYKYGGYRFDRSFIPIKGEGDLKTLEEFHRSILDEMAYPSSADDDDLNYDEEWFETISGDFYITYETKRGMAESRRYTLSSDFLSGSDALARLLASDSMKDYMSIRNLLGYDALGTPEVAASLGSGFGETASLDTDVREKLTGDSLKELAACLDEDYMAMSADDMMHPGAELFTLLLSSKRPEGMQYESGAAATSGKGEPIRESIKEDLGEVYSLPYTVTEKNVKAIAWMKNAGIYDSLMKSAEELRKKALSMMDEVEPEPEELEEAASS
jgi:hypothetical protein